MVHTHRENLQLQGQYLRYSAMPATERHTPKKQKLTFSPPPNKQKTLQVTQSNTMSNTVQISVYHAFVLLLSSSSNHWFKDHHPVVPFQKSALVQPPHLEQDSSPQGQPS